MVTRKSQLKELSQYVRNFVQCAKRKHSGGLSATTRQFSVKINKVHGFINTAVD